MTSVRLKPFCFFCLFVFFPQTARQLKAANSHFPISAGVANAQNQESRSAALKLLPDFHGFNSKKSDLLRYKLISSPLIHTTRICSDSEGGHTVKTATACQPGHKRLFFRFFTEPANSRIPTGLQLVE